MADTESDRALEQILAAANAGDSNRLRAGLRDPEFRGIAARYLGKAGDAEAIPKIQLLLDAADPKARLGAVRALAALRTPLTPKIRSDARGTCPGRVASRSEGDLKIRQSWYCLRRGRRRAFGLLRPATR